MSVVEDVPWDTYGVLRTTFRSQVSSSTMWGSGIKSGRHIWEQAPLPDELSLTILRERVWRSLNVEGDRLGSSLYFTTSKVCYYEPHMI